MKRILIALCTGSLLLTPPETAGTRKEILKAPEAVETAVEAEAGTDTVQGPDISAPSAVLMEASTGKVIYEKDADRQRRPASITKIMTLILIFDAIDSGKIKMTD